MARKQVSKEEVLSQLRALSEKEAEQVIREYGGAAAMERIRKTLQEISLERERLREEDRGLLRKRGALIRDLAQLDGREVDPRKPIQLIELVARYSPDGMVRYDELSDILLGMGWDTNRDDEDKRKRAISSYLSRDPSFRRVSKGEWVLAEEDKRRRA